MPTRRDALYRFLDDVTARARAASERKLPSLRADGFAGAVGGVTASADPAACPFLLRVVVARELVQHRSLFGTPALTIEWAGPAADAKALKVADTFIPDNLRYEAPMRETTEHPPTTIRKRAD